MAEGTGNKLQVAGNPLPVNDTNDDLSITFVDSAYKVPRNIATRIHRLNLLLDEHPEATDFHFQELDDNRFKRVLEDASIQVVEPFMYRPEKQVKLALVNDNETFFKFVFNNITGGQIAIAFDSNRSYGSFIMSCVPIESCLDDVLFSLSKFKSKKHNPQILACLYCPKAWWLENVGTSFEYSFVQKFDPRSNQSVISNMVAGYEVRDVFINMYAACYAETYAISVTLTLKDIK